MPPEGTPNTVLAMPGPVIVTHESGEVATVVKVYVFGPPILPIAAFATFHIEFASVPPPIPTDADVAESPSRPPHLEHFARATLTRSKRAQSRRIRERPRRGGDRQ